MIITGMNHFQKVCLKKLVEWYHKNYPDVEFDFDDAVDQLAKEISDVIDGFTCEIMKDSDPLVQSLMIAAIDRIDFYSIAKMLIEDYIKQM